MANAEIAQSEDANSGMVKKLWLLFIIGFFIIIIGVIILIVAAVFYGDGSANLGVIIFIGPVPFVFGVGPDATWMILFSIVFTVLSLIIYVIFRRETKANV
jgi:uncharacterized membrane protein